ncbi:MAG: hypothetical protein QM791_12115 [Ferruginibacter sp.]
MKYFLSILLIVVVCCSSCNDSNETTGKKDSPQADSASAVTETYRQQLQTLSGIKNISQMLAQDWILEDDKESLTYSDNPEGMYVVRSINLSSDGSFTKDVRNYMQYGNWEFDEASKKIILEYHDGTKDVYKIIKLAADELVMINSGIESITQLKYVSDAKRYREPADDPFHISNNQWRIKPSKKEAEEQVRQRMKDYLHFHILFYRDFLARDEKKISFYGFPTCLKWYAGGIYIVKEADLAENWFKCFYNKENAMKGYKMMDDIIGKKYQWPKGNISWVQKNLAVLEQMYAKL